MSTTTRRGEVLALLCDRESVAQLAEALRPGTPGPAGRPTSGTPVRRVERVAELRAALGERRWAVIVVQARDADRVPTDEAVRAVRQEQPDAVVVGYARRTDLSSAILAFARAGVHELVVEGVDDMGVALRAALAAAVRRSGAERLIEDVAQLVPPSIVPMLRYCLEHYGDAASVPEVARGLGITRQALLERSHRAGVPSPRALLAWSRLLLAARMLADPRNAVADVAFALHFPSESGLRNTLRRYAGLGVAELRRAGAAPVLRAFAEAIEAARHGEPAPATV